MATGWIEYTAKKYKTDLTEQQAKKDERLRREEVERQRLNRIAAEGPTVGTQRWEALQYTLKHDVAEFNEALHDTVLRTKALGNGTFEVHLGEPGGAEKIASAAYASDTTTLFWQIIGGAKGTPLTVGLEPSPDIWQLNTNELQFTSGSSYYSVGEISQSIISALLS